MQKSLVSADVSLLPTTAERESDRARAKTRINIGDSFERWRELRGLMGNAVFIPSKHHRFRPPGPPK
uniref:Uncharacterized protein n=1 Tax=Sparus aurata TaxID=8175 RepID=A0A671WPY3_SPAAU